MATYAVGDIHGCFATLQNLLRRIRFDRGQDRLWLVGDLVNRGPRSLETLRWAREMGDRLVLVLGNHDLHLLARAAGLGASRPRDTLDEVLEARDRDALLDWLRERPLLHRDGFWVMVHAGFLPSWTVNDAERLAGEVSELLRGRRRARLLKHLRDEPPAWKDDLADLDRAHTAVAALTRLRVTTPEGRMHLKHSGPPDTAPAGFQPWFDVPGRRSADHSILFGHWASLGVCIRENAVGLDTGCSWGRTLTAFRLDDRALFEEPLADTVAEAAR